MGDQDEENGVEGRSLRRTRRSTRNVSETSISPKSKTPRKTRKKAVVMDVSEDEAVDDNIEDKNVSENNVLTDDDQMLKNIQENIESIVEEISLKKADTKDENAESIMETNIDDQEDNTKSNETNGDAEEKIHTEELENKLETMDSENLTENSADLNEEFKDVEQFDEKKSDSDTEEDDVAANLRNGDPDAENISEDELPTVQAVKVPETEEVSDEELPGPKRAELPADTEVVSEDELPSVKKDTTKRKLTEGEYDPGSPTSEGEAPAKKPAVEKEAEKEKDEKPPKPKKLPELDKFWKAVNDDPTDFTGWTYLLQYVDQENDMEAAREAYDAFLSHYPYCYGYWRKYADYEKRKGNKKKCEEVFERGLKSIPLSVDLWLHYLTYVKMVKAEDEDFVRSQFERALVACGLEFRSDRLWDSYIKWETESKRLQRVTGIYDRLLGTPTQGYTAHFESFQEHITTNPPNKVVEIDEFLALRKEVRNVLKHDSDTPVNSDAPPGDEDPNKMVSTDEETKLIRERIISIRRKMHKNTVTAVTSRWNYEEGIKRPYFHVKPLERCQLKNWQEYLDYEIQQGDKTRTIVLFERCLIACALYEEFWLKFVHYLESLKEEENVLKIRDVFERACTIHHLKKPNLHLQWALFEESNGNCNRAAEILVNLEKSVPNLLQIAYRRIGLERRRCENEKCTQLFEQYINGAKSKTVASNLSIKYARFTLHILKNYDKTVEIIKSAIAKDPTNSRLYLQLIDLILQNENHTEMEIIEVIDQFLEKEGCDLEQKILFAQRKLEYLEDFGSDIKNIEKAYEEYQKLYKQGSRDSTKKKDSKSENSAAKKEKTSATSSTAVSQYGSYGNYSSSPNQSGYQYSGSQPSQGQYNYAQYGQNDQYTYQNWQYQQSGYSGYNQWGGYGGGYSY